IRVERSVERTDAGADLERPLPLQRQRDDRWGGAFDSGGARRRGRDHVAQRERCRSEAHRARARGCERQPHPRGRSAGDQRQNAAKQVERNEGGRGRRNLDMTHRAILTSVLSIGVLAATGCHAPSSVSATPNAGTAVAASNTSWPAPAPGKTYTLMPTPKTV